MLDPVSTSFRRAIAGVTLSVLAATAAVGACADHWTIPSDTVARAFCDVVDASNSKGTVPVLKKPNCPRNGPSSKCNPSSIVFPEIGFTGLITTYPDGSYSLLTLATVRAPDQDGSANWLGQIAEKTYENSTMVDATKYSPEASDWTISDPDITNRADEFQVALQQHWPWVASALESGASVVYVIQEP